MFRTMLERKGCVGGVEADVLGAQHNNVRDCAAHHVAQLEGDRGVVAAAHQAVVDLLQ